MDEELTFGPLMVVQRNVVWRLVQQCISAYPQIGKALVLGELLAESGPIHFQVMGVSNGSNGGNM